VTDSTQPTPQTATQNFQIAVASLLTIISATLPTGQVQVAYQTTLQAQGGTTPYTWGLSSGSLPPGLSLNPSTGSISGTPTTAGTSSFTIAVTDSGQPTAQTASKAFQITIAAPLVITTTSLPSGQVQVAYQTTLQAQGGVTPYTWAVSSGALPSGLALSASTGSISGTPTQSGTFSFVVKVTDSSQPTAQIATASFQITVAAASTTTHSVTLTWTASTSSVSGYYAYRGAQSGGPYTKLNSSLVAGTSYTDGSVQAGQTYYYVVTAVANGIESAYSNEAKAVVPSP
jgi:hypothetical protein